MIRKNLFSILIAIIILYLSMASSKSFDRVQLNIPYADKFVHFGMYFSLMTSLLLENRSRLSRRKTVFLLALIPFFYGILMEILQSFTLSRTASAADAAADTAGIAFSVLLWLIARPAGTAKSE